MQTCVAISERFKVVLTGGKDRIIRVWNPLIQIENVGVEYLKGHGARIIGLQVIDKFGSLISAATDKTIRLWDLQTFQELCKLHDSYQHRPVDRLTSISYDDTSGRLFTFGNRGRVWAVAPGSIQAVDAVGNGEGDVGAGAGKSDDVAKKALSKTGVDREMEKEQQQMNAELADSGWTVVNIKDIAEELVREYGDGKVIKLPNLDLLTGSRFEVKEENLEEIEKDKWIQLQDSLELARDVGLGELTIGACYSNVFHQLVAVGVHHCCVVNLETGAQVCRFRVSKPAVVTTCTLDASERRLFTGAHDGAVRSYNFNSGVMLGQYKSMNSELTSMIFLPSARFVQRPVVAGGWDKKVTMWSDSPDEDCENLTIGTHTSDILGLQYIHRPFAPYADGALALLLLSADAAGNVMVWTATSGRLVQNFSADTFTESLSARKSLCDSLQDGGGAGGGGPGEAPHPPPPHT